MSHFNFFLTAALSLAFSVWVNLNFTSENVLYWPALISSPIIFMVCLAIISKTISGIVGFFSR